MKTKKGAKNAPLSYLFSRLYSRKPHHLVICSHKDKCLVIRQPVVIDGFQVIHKNGFTGTFTGYFSRATISESNSITRNGSWTADRIIAGCTADNILTFCKHDRRTLISWI